AFENLAGVFAAAHQHDSFYTGFLPHAKDACRRSSADLHLPDIAHEDRHTFGFGDHDRADVVGAPDQADAADGHRLLAVVEHGPTCVLIVRSDGLRDLADRQVVTVQGSRVDFDLVLLDETAERRHIGDA